MQLAAARHQGGQVVLGGEAQRAGRVGSGALPAHRQRQHQGRAGGVAVTEEHHLQRNRAGQARGWSSRGVQLGGRRVSTGGTRAAGMHQPTWRTGQPTPPSPHLLVCLPAGCIHGQHLVPRMQLVHAQRAHALHIHLGVRGEAVLGGRGGGGWGRWAG